MRALIFGFLAMAVSATAIASAKLFGDRLPPVITQTADGLPWTAALTLLPGLVVGLTLRTGRPRSRLVPLLALLYAAAAMALGLIIGSAPTAYVVSTTPAQERLITLDAILGGFQQAAMAYAEPIQYSWPYWTLTTIPALLAFTLVAFKVRRTRGNTLATVTSAPEDHSTADQRGAFDPVQPPEQRGAFEPVQPPEKRGAFDPVQPPRPAGAPFMPPQDRQP
ncbi:hypothetical protein [Nonomuraea endophytica]|uniref:MFS transporter n=1 Tax=Nonomuraea endophytica TaxID=714136 RepID=A0A7W8ADG5_9ACTN|nr:hypothetical protein [Nonomuraea endophytica]MBB5084286.1 hypothetical protein [Nonomuraea endophytica]